MPFYSSVNYYDKYRTQNHFIAMIRTPLLHLLYKKKPQKQQNTKNKKNPTKTTNPKQQKKQTPKLQRSTSSAGVKQHSIFEVIQTLGW